MAIEKQEKHHVSFTLWSGKRPVVTVITQTHSARKFDLSESSEVATDYSTEPGITLRDIRLAVLLENFARDSKLVFSPPAGTNEHDAATNLSRFEKDSWEDILSRYPWK
ncbi:hypothetical protein GALMADRAFT_258261 [Galerina marginata CBS 339.88]|uniref:Uncharacterized protein n=1 Tax=Galerina marginata (strain CBS 339.88) TaxID=685588 RepID=A0A067SIP0_GALM3|nr:hypothetical protein GALMADRAFT_258261 [Galerina marginata CBS 339.88]